jgi:hypothetical protein
MLGLRFKELRALAGHSCVELKSKREGIDTIDCVCGNGKHLVVRGHVHNLRYEVRDEGLTHPMMFVAMVGILLFEIMFTISMKASYLGCKKGVQRFGYGG